MIAGLPRSGTTLLSAVFDQSPSVYIEGTSGLFSIVNAVLEACLEHPRRSRFIKGVGREDKTLSSVLPSIFSSFYPDVDESLTIIDKSRGWNKHHILELVDKYTDIDPKVIVLYRPVEDVLKSFASLMSEEERTEEFYRKLLDRNNPLIRNLLDIGYAMKSKLHYYKFIQYDELVNDFESVKEDCCSFFEIENFEVEQNKLGRFKKDPNVDPVFKNLHKVRNGVERQVKNIELPESVSLACSELNTIIGLE